MAIEVKVVCDSINYAGKRLTTFTLKYPRFLLPELNTHRVFSRSTASSRAIPTNKMLEMARTDPAMPIYYGRNEVGMVASQEVTPQEKDRAVAMWLGLRDQAVETVKSLIVKTNLHKQISNRLLEPWLHAFTIVTSCDWENFFNLRCSPDAQPEMKALAEAMWAAQQASTPTLLKPGEWHLPFVSQEEKATLSAENQLKCSVARCARVSYLNHDGTTPDVNKDIALHDRLLDNFHLSPLEHQATPRGLTNDVKMLYRKYIKGAKTESNFHKSWTQYRKFIDDEHLGKKKER